ncbi:MAG TPA: PBP1A family penicillin-binding protein [Candidatus Paceibacterota bacterium]|nr:PBP1A family penicillin-binding protein [Candidatus Paceibacterota bacterium]
MIKKYLKKPSIKNIILILLAAGLVITGILVIWVSTLKLPDFKSFTERKIQSSTKIYDRTGEILLYDVHQNIKRTVIPYEDMGVNILNATVAIEDSNFYQHKGIRITSIIRATIWAKLTGRRIQGGSTITQQLIKNTLLTPEVSISRKIKEWILSVKLEKVMSKEEILALYLNEAPYGGNIYGIEEATKAFLGKKPKELTLAEAAYMAAIPNGPTYYSPYGKNKDKLDERKNLVLKRMLDIKFITEEEYTKAKSEQVTFLPKQPMNIGAPHFVFFIKDYLENRYGAETLEEGGLKVTTTLDYELQKKAEEIAFTKARENEKNWDGNNAAVVVIDPKTGQILSMVGSRDYFDKTIDGNFNVATAPRQPGSSFKPIVYALAFEKGYTEKTTLFDVKTEFNSSCRPDGSETRDGCYTPDNYDNAFRGPMTLRDGLAQSINVIAVKLLYLVGVSDSIKMARNLGITTLLNDPNRYGLSLVIGGGETTLLDMTSAYSVFANSGVRNPYQGILKVEDSKGNILEEYQNKSQQVIKPNTTYILSSILSDDVARTPTFGANSVLKIPGRQVAVKTGTTNDNKDAWTIGYTPSVTVGVWVGNNDNKPMKKGGAALAGPIWNGVMTEALKDSPVESFNAPEQIDPSIPPILRGFWQGGETFTVDSISNKLATEYTPEESRKEISITNVHTILYWIDKENPLEEKKSSRESDSQYENWEYGVQRWWNLNKNKYQMITLSDKPTSYDNIHTMGSKPILEVVGIGDKAYSKNDSVFLSINSKGINPIKKIDVFVNSTYITSLRSYPYTTNFSLSNVDNLSKTNTVRVIGVDVLGNMTEISTSLKINNI